MQSRPVPRNAKKVVSIVFCPAVGMVRGPGARPRLVWGVRGTRPGDGRTVTNADRSGRARCGSRGAGRDGRWRVRNFLRALGPGAPGRLRGRDNHVVFIDSGGQWWRPAYDRPADIDFTVPSPARMYDYYLSGKGQFPGRQGSGREGAFARPVRAELARANRDFLVRAVTDLARQGIDQFIDARHRAPDQPERPRGGPVRQS